MKSKPTYTLLHGDCLLKLQELPDNSVDSIVTDPPYGLSFMSNAWDKTVPSVEVWIECLRVLKPGGHLLAFAGTRTQHRMATAIEDAGFEIRDMIAWVYGCFSEDTECFTDNGWKLYSEINKGDRILQWDSQSNQLSWYTPDDVFVFDAPDSMIRISNRHTDQILTENHRVYAKIRRHSRNPLPTEYEVVNAGDIKKHWYKDLPMAGELLGGERVKDAYMIGWWLTDAWLHGGGKACMFSQSKEKTLGKLRKALTDSECSFSEYIKESKNDNHRDEHTFYVTGELAHYLIKNFPDRKITYDIMNWDYQSRYDLLEGLLDGDGSRSIDQSAETFWSMDKERLDIVQILCSSLNIRNHIDYEKGCVYLNRKTNSTQLQNKHTLGKVEYNGNKVWCLKTDTGAFLVRRAGKPFISGNSGFPKSQNVSKAIDKAAGAEQEVVGHSPVPSTDEARQWEGWGSALKPALEPITMARKPFTGTIADSVKKNGTGALNIDGCRVEPEEGGRPLREVSPLRDDVQYGGNSLAGRVDQSLQTSKAVGSTNVGRWPANIIHDGSDEVLAAFPDAKGQQGDLKAHSKKRQSPNGCYGTFAPANDHLARVETNTSAARFFYCAKASKKDRNEGCDLEDNKNNHPTVKPTELMKYLVRLVTPPGGTTLDPYTGSGSTGKAAIAEGFNFIGCELSDEYIKIADARIKFEVDRYGVSSVKSTKDKPHNTDTVQPKTDTLVDSGLFTKK